MDYRDSVVGYSLEREFGLSPYELLDALKSRFRARLTLQRFATVQTERRIRT